MKVEFTNRDGKTKAVDSKIAKVLFKLGRGTYITTDLGAVRAQKFELEPETDGAAGGQDDIEKMALQELRDYAKSIGAQHHHAAGAEKVRVAIRERLAARVD